MQSIGERIVVQSVSLKDRIRFFLWLLANTKIRKPLVIPYSFFGRIFLALKHEPDSMFYDLEFDYVSAHPKVSPISLKLFSSIYNDPDIRIVQLNERTQYEIDGSSIGLPVGGYIIIGEKMANEGLQFMRGQYDNRVLHILERNLVPSLANSLRRLEEFNEASS